MVPSYPRTMASTKCPVLLMNRKRKATEPACEPAVAGQGGGVVPAVLSPDPTARCRFSHRFLLPQLAARVRHEKDRRSPSVALASEPARVQYSGCSHGRKSRSIQHGRFCPHPAGLRSRPVGRPGHSVIRPSEQINAQVSWVPQRHPIAGYLPAGCASPRSPCRSLPNHRISTAP